MDHREEGYQGIVLYNDRGALRSQVYFPSDKAKFDGDLKRGTLEGSVLNAGTPATIIASKWLDEPVNRARLAEINTQFYDETLMRLAGV